MPFLESFGFTAYPFALTPDAAMYYPLPESEAILASLHFALGRGDGLMKVVGEVGTGKTLLCRMLLRRMADEKNNIAYLNVPDTSETMPVARLVGSELGVKAEALKANPATALRDYLLAQHAKGRRTVLVIDEAQALGANGLEAVRLLSNLETDTHKLLQIVLFGQPELDRLLARPELRQVQQRVQFSFQTRPMTPDRVADYLRFRLAQVTQGGGGRKLKAKQPVLSPVQFTNKASLTIAKASRGLPRLIHVLADKSLIAAYAKGDRLVDSPHVRLAARETDGLSFPFSWLKWL